MIEENFRDQNFGPLGLTWGIWGPDLRIPSMKYFQLCFFSIFRVYMTSLYHWHPVFAPKILTGFPPDVIGWCTWRARFAFDVQSPVLLMWRPWSFWRGESETFFNYFPILFSKKESSFSTRYIIIYRLPMVLGAETLHASLNQCSQRAPIVFHCVSVYVVFLF